MNINFLPDDINTLIISYLVPTNPKSVLDIESYCNLSLVNKEFSKNVLKYKQRYKLLKDKLEDYKIDHKFRFEIIKYQILDKVPIIVPSTSNEGCLICGNYIPMWWPMLFSGNNIQFIDKQDLITEWDIRTNGCIGYGLCGHCSCSNMLCSICMIKFNYYKVRRVNFTSGISSYLECSGCYVYRKCKWCEKDIHPLMNLESQLGGDKDYNNYCSLYCYREHQDWQYYVFTCRW